LGGFAAWRITSFFAQAHFTFTDIGTALGLGFITLVRVMVLIALASIIWTPIGIYVGLRPKLTAIVQPVAQFLAAFPNNLLFPLVVSLIVFWNANPDIWLSPLIVLGTQWYILFNVIAGAMSIPSDLREAASLYKFTRWQRWTTLILPGIFPYLITGMVTASGGAWNASVFAEYANIQGRTIQTIGLGAQIDAASADGRFPILLLATIMISLMVVTMNRLVWRRLYRLAETRYKLEG
jgi:NitT/TauT family transport system permease protein